MAELWKNHYGAEIPRTIAGMIQGVFPRFDREAFLRDALKGYEALELMDRGRKISVALRQHLPEDYEEAIEMLVASAKADSGRSGHRATSAFLLMPHLFFVMDYGLDHFEVSMRAQYELTQRFTAEFSIRPFLVRYPEPTMQKLRAWARDPNVHVRRLVSEGTRPRLPWAPRLRMFQEDPRPVLKLLELLKDDAELYVRRSVANNLNDIGKDHPDVLVETAKRWMMEATEERRWLVRHALRSAVKRGDPGALGVLGFGRPAEVVVDSVKVSPARVCEGGAVTLEFDLLNKEEAFQRVLVDFRVHFVKANGNTKPKVFKLKAVGLDGGARVRLSKTLSLKLMTTRKHYPGVHRIDLLLNGRDVPLGEFLLETERKK